MVNASKFEKVGTLKPSSGMRLSHAEADFSMLNVSFIVYFH